MSIALFLVSSLGVAGIVGLMTVVAQNASYREGYREGYRRATYDAAQIQCDIDGRRNQEPTLR